MKTRIAIAVTTLSLMIPALSAAPAFAVGGGSGGTHTAGGGSCSLWQHYRAKTTGVYCGYVGM